MKENKKRFRPTLGGYRALENEVSELRDALESQIAGTSVIVHDCYAWRDKYRDLLKRFGGLSIENEALRRENERLRNRGFLARLLDR